MLSELQIENLAVIEYANLTLGENLNIFTGETGAGKSILIHGINAILGQRMSKEIVRTGAQTAIVTASFINLPDEVKEKLIEQGYNSDGDKLVIRREINESGKGSVKINDKVATNAFLREVTLNLVNIHGQHDSQILLAPEKHLAILDSFAGIDDQLSSYKNNFRSLQEIARKIQKLTMTEVEKLQTEEILQYQINEIESLKIKPDEDIALERELAIMRNSTQVFELLKRSYDNLNGIDDTPGAAELARSTADMVAELLEFMPYVNELHARLTSVGIELDDIRDELADYLDGVEVNPQRLDIVEARLSDLHKLQRKYGMTVNECLTHLEKCKTELDDLQSFDDVIEELKERKKQILAGVKEQAKGLSSFRHEAADNFVKLVSSELEYLDMPNVRIEVSFEEGNLTPAGMDNVEFLISANIGEPPKPISKIASGGELSRIMLALKNVLADKDDIPTLIFDEIDAGISGIAAQKVGYKLSQIAKHRQVLCVTHLSQIAIMADVHMLIEKSVENERTYTKVTKLDFEGQKHEIARIMAGDMKTELMLKNAEELLKSKGQPEK